MSESIEEAMEAFQKYDFQKAFDISSKIVKYFPNNGQAWNLMALACKLGNNLPEAIKFAEEAIRADANNHEYYLTTGSILEAQNRVEEAKEKFMLACQLDKTTFSLLKTANFFLNQQNFQNAIDLYNKILQKEENFDALNNIGFCYLQIDDLEKAEEFLTRAVKDEKAIHAYYNLSILYSRQDKPEKVNEILDNLLNSSQDSIEVLNNIANIYLNSNNFKKALEYYNKCLEINPNIAAIHHNIASVFVNIKNLPLAEKAFENALRLEQYNISFNMNYIVSLIQQNKTKEAYDELEKFATKFSKNLFYYQEKSKLEFFSGNFKGALNTAQEGLNIFNNDYLLVEIIIRSCVKERMYVESLPFFNHFLAKFPKNIEIAALYIFAKANICEWNYIEDFHYLKELLLEQWEQGNSAAIPPFAIQFIPEAKDISLKIYKERAKVCELIMPKVNYEYVTDQNKLKIAYFSCDFSYHPVALQVRSMFKNHNKEKFETFVFDIGKPGNCEFNKVIRESCDNYFNLYGKDSTEIANFINKQGINILVDLSGFTGEARPEILANKPAPIQCHILGESCSLGASFIDYFLSDSYLIDDINRNDFSENVVYLPITYVTEGFEEPKTKYSKEDFKLPENKFVFCYFGKLYRIDKFIFSCWMEILKKTENSVLWLRADTQQIANQILHIAKSFGIESDRLILTSEGGLSQTWQMKHTDLWLDTFNASSGTSVFLSFWCNTPVLSIKGDTMQSRVSASLCHYHGFDDLVTNSKEEYINKAVEFCQNPKMIKDLKNKLSKAKQTSVLFNTKRHIQKLEQAYEKMWQNYKDNKKEDINIE